MPEIPKGEYEKLRESAEWLEKKMKEVLERDYGHGEATNAL